MSKNDNERSYGLMARIGVTVMLVTVIGLITTVESPLGFFSAGFLFAVVLASLATAFFLQGPDGTQSRSGGNKSKSGRNSSRPFCSTRGGL